MKLLLKQTKFVNNKYRIFLVLLLTYIIFTRIYSVFAIYPGNAPDEPGHIAITTALSQPTILTLKESFSYTTYRYAMYNPFAYIPGAFALKIASLFNPSINKMDRPLTITKKMIFSARIGGLLWFFMFLFFLYKIKDSFSKTISLYFLGIIALIPQITFIQSYDNTDKMGVATFIYLIWALKEKKLLHISLAIFLTMNCKMNFFVTLPLPFILFYFWYYKDIKEYFSKTFLYLFLPILFGSGWYIWNYFVNVYQYDGLLGFTALINIDNVKHFHPELFTLKFIAKSLASAFGYFGWMNLPLHMAYYFIWTLIICLIGLIYLFKSNLIIKNIRENSTNAWNLGFAVIFLLNWGAHYWAGYQFYSPQGRYLFPAIIILLIFYLKFAERILKQNKFWGHSLLTLTFIFIMISSINGLIISKLNPWRDGVEISPANIIQNENKQLIKNLKVGDIISQSFLATTNKIKIFAFHPKPLKKKIDINYKIRLLDKNRNILSETISDGQFITLQREKFIKISDKGIPLKIGNKYEIAIEILSANTNKDIFLISRSEKNVYKNGNASINGKNMPYDLAFYIF